MATKHDNYNGKHRGVYEGKKGQRKLRAIDRQFEKIEAEFDNEYSESPEMIFLAEEVRWEGTAKLIFILALRNVNYAWNGLHDYGFIRLCSKWIKEREIGTLSSNNAATMVKSILPKNMCENLIDELSALEIS